MTQRSRLAAAFMAALLSSSAHAAEVRLGLATYLGDYAPMMEVLFKEAGLSATTALYPAERSLRMLEAGDLDVEGFRQPGAVAGFRDKVRLIGPAACLSVVAFARSDDPNPLAPERSSGLRIGFLLGNRIAEAAATELGTDLFRIATHQQLFRMLDAGRIDIVVESEGLGQREVIALQLQARVRKVLPPLKSSGTFIVVRHHLDDWGPRIEAAYAKMLADGRWLKYMGDINERHQQPRNTSTQCLHPGKGR